MSVLLFLEEVKFKNNIYINRYIRKVKVLEFVGDEGGVVKVKEIICENWNILNESKILLIIFSKKFYEECLDLFI